MNETTLLLPFVSPTISTIPDHYCELVLGSLTFVFSRCRVAMERTSSGPINIPASRRDEICFALGTLDMSGKIGNHRGQRALPPSGLFGGVERMVDEVPHERRPTRLGPSTWRRIGTSTLPMAEDASWNAICKAGWRRVIPRL